MVNVSSYEHRPLTRLYPNIFFLAAYAYYSCTIHTRSHVYIFTQYYCTRILYCIGTVYKLVIDIVTNKQENKQTKKQ